MKSVHNYLRTFVHFYLTVNNSYGLSQIKSTGKRKPCGMSKEIMRTMMHFKKMVGKLSLYGSVNLRQKRKPKNAWNF